MERRKLKRASSVLLQSNEVRERDLLGATDIQSSLIIELWK